MIINIPVLVTGAGGGGIGEQVIKCLRMSDLNLTIHASDVSLISKGVKDGDFFTLLPLASAADYVSAVISYCLMHTIKVVIPGSEPELKVLSQHREEFKKLEILLLINSEEVIETCLDKFKTVKFFEANNIHTPQSDLISSIEELEQINYFPVVLKPVTGGGGSVNIMIAQNRDELILFSTYLLKIYDSFLLQAYIGTPDSEYTVGVLSDLDGQLINVLVLRRNIVSGLGNKIKVPNQTGRKDLGNALVISSGISQGEIIRHDLIQNECIAIAQKTNSKGPLNIQCRLVDGKVFVFEINPRFSGTSPMRALAGFNEPELLIKKHILNQAITPFFEFEKGHVLRGLTETFL